MSRQTAATNGHKQGTERLGAFSDAVIAVIITIMVLELKAPEGNRLADLLPLWPTALSYAVSYLFVAIVWVNHHHLLRFVDRPTVRLVWINFAHLFAVSLVPFATAWIARTHLAPVPVAIYGGIFVGVNAAYRVFERAVHEQASTADICPRARIMARRRSPSTLLMFATASVLALRLPDFAFALICAALVLYLRPEAPGSLLRTSAAH